MDIKLKNNNENRKSNKRMIIFAISGAILCILLSLIFTLYYPTFHKESKNYYKNPIENEEFLTGLYESTYALYRDLYEKVNNETVSYSQLYMEVKQEGQKDEELLLEPELSFQYRNEVHSISSHENTDLSVGTMSTESVLEEVMAVSASNFESSLENIAQYLDYCIKDAKTGILLTNTSKDMEKDEEFYCYISLTFDEFGNIENIKAKGENSDALLKIAAEIGRRNSCLAYDLSDIEKALGVKVYFSAPKSCKVAFGLTNEMWNSLEETEGYNEYNRWWTLYAAYQRTGIASWFFMVFLAVVLFFCFFPIEVKGVVCHKVFEIPLEILFCIIYILCSLYSSITELVMDVCEGTMAEFFVSFLGISDMSAVSISYICNVIILFLILSGTSYCCVCLRMVKEVGIRETIRERSWIYRIFPYLKKKWQQLYQYMTSFDINTDTNKMIIKILVINGVLVSLFTMFWVGGIFAVVIYSLILYVVLRKYVSGLKEKYTILLKATNQIAEGNLNVTIEEDLGLFEPFKPQIEKIQEGFRNAVEEEVKSQRMKTELITNVSHDLKTPLTAIITYINLLQEEGVTKEEQKEYLSTLERKSMHLKRLIEDLFEVSKANSNNISLDLKEVDLNNLIKQVCFELEDKIKEANLDIRLNFSQEKCILKLDSQKTYRIYENLVNNICKYALKGTRVFIECRQEEDSVWVVMKNISAMEIQMNPEELTERFVRGDTSRNTEGSGLGLAIAQSFTRLQGGEMEISVDGDLFKVTTCWKREGNNQHFAQT